MKTYEKMISWVLQIVVALILVKAGYAKLIRSDQSFLMFETLKMGLWGMKFIGIIELGTGALLVTYHLPHYGALLSFSLMMGALIAHLTVLGINFNSDGGVHFVVMLCLMVFSITIMYFRRRNLPLIGHTYKE